MGALLDLAADVTAAVPLLGMAWDVGGEGGRAGVVDAANEAAGVGCKKRVT